MHEVLVQETEVDRALVQQVVDAWGGKGRGARGPCGLLLCHTGLCVTKRGGNYRQTTLSVFLTRGDSYELRDVVTWLVSSPQYRTDGAIEANLGGENRNLS